MKRDTRAQHELNYLAKQCARLKQQAAETKNNKLWRLESIIRSRLKDLKALQTNELSGYKRVFDDYVALLNDVSTRLLERYNTTNKTDYVFEEVVKGNFSAYLRSGIISILVTNHIPRIVAEEFGHYLPENPMKSERSSLDFRKRRSTMTNWKQYYDEHLTTMDEAAAAVKSGDTIWLGSTLCIPDAFMDKLADRVDELHDVTLLANMRCPFSPDRRLI